MAASAGALDPQARTLTVGEDSSGRRLLDSAFDVGGPWYMYVIIPVIAGIVGYITNVVALKMTFYPIEFYGPKLWQPEGQPFGFFGWQGIIPSKAGKMAGILTDLMTAKLIDVKAVFGRVDPAKVSALCGEGMMRCTQAAVDAVGMQEFPAIWGPAPMHVRQEIYELAAKDAELFATMLVRAMQSNILDVMNLKHLVVSRAEANKNLVVQMFQEVGAKEFVFIERSGLYFGAMFGLLQAAVYYVYKGWWVLPVAGFLVGWVTNVLALKLIFQPTFPVKILCFPPLQGVFLKRQKEVSAQMSAMSQDYYLKQRYLWPEIMNGDKRENFNRLVEEVTVQFTDGSINAGGHVAVTLALGRERYQRIQKAVAKVIAEELPAVVTAAYEYMEKAMDIETDMRSKLEVLPPDEFVGVLRPVFQEDEIKLIAVGGVLGACVGLLQHFALFAYIS